MIKRPQPIKEIVIKPMLGFLLIEIASRRAFDWINSEGDKFGHCMVSREDNEPSATGMLLVSSCFDENEVIEHLSNPQYVENNVLKIVE